MVLNREKFRPEANRRKDLTDEQITRLNAIGMRWDSKQDIIWENGFEKAKEYSENYGAADAPANYVTEDGYKLGVWLCKCRERQAKGTLSEERIKRLESINMVWSKSRKNDWDECFECVKEYYLEHGDVNIPPDFKANGIWLNKWLSEQRQIILGKRKGKKLKDEQIEKLRSVGFIVDGNITVQWLEKYNDLKCYYNRYGNLKLPVGYKNSKGET